MIKLGRAASAAEALIEHGFLAQGDAEVGWPVDRNAPDDDANHETGTSCAGKDPSIVATRVMSPAAHVADTMNRLGSDGLLRPIMIDPSGRSIMHRAVRPAASTCDAGHTREVRVRSAR